eukprot:5855912-Pyramimonas_sp.AAC.1
MDCVTPLRFHLLRAGVACKYSSTKSMRLACSIPSWHGHEKSTWFAELPMSGTFYQLVQI